MPVPLDRLHATVQAPCASRQPGGSHRSPPAAAPPSAACRRGALPGRWWRSRSQSLLCCCSRHLARQRRRSWGQRRNGCRRGWTAARAGSCARTASAPPRTQRQPPAVARRASCCCCRVLLFAPGAVNLPSPLDLEQARQHQLMHRFTRLCVVCARCAGWAVTECGGLVERDDMIHPVLSAKGQPERHARTVPTLNLLAALDGRWSPCRHAHYPTLRQHLQLGQLSQNPPWVMAAFPLCMCWS